MNRRLSPTRQAAALAGAVIAVAACMTLAPQTGLTGAIAYPIVDTNQTVCYDDTVETACPAAGEAFYGQDAQVTGNTPSYSDNGDGTVLDTVTGLTWQQSPDTDGDGDIDSADKLSHEASVAYCDGLSLAGHSDWRLPDIKQLYSLIDFSGLDPSGYEGTDTSGLTPFIDTEYFDFAYGDTANGERIIDAQYASSTLYVGNSNMPLLFGVNFADGRIKGYGLELRGRDKTFYLVCVRESSTYGVNDLSDNGDGTVTDGASGLMWAQEDSGVGLNWEEALAWVETHNAAELLGYSDWRMPNVKELQSIVDYGRSPDTTGSAAIDPLFDATAVANEGGQPDFGYYWSSTTHANWTKRPGSAAAYVSFGRSMGYMGGTWFDVHGAGSQRSDPKDGDPADWPTGRGPQGDALRIYNLVRLVRDADAGGPDTPKASQAVVDTGQAACYAADGSEIPCPVEGEAFYGQDAQFDGAEFAFVDNGDGTVSDTVTGLGWQQAPSDRRYSWDDAQDHCTSLSLGTHDDWRAPSLEELFSISDFETGWPYLDTEYFSLLRTPDMKMLQFWSSNHYEVGTTHGGAPSAFGVNHGTGHIKAYPDGSDGQPMAAKYVRCVRGDSYGVSDFVDNEDGTVTDESTGLMWLQDDTGSGVDWEGALAIADGITLAGYDDWRLPNVKELQSIVDYSGVYPAIDASFFNITDDDAYFWSSTSAYFGTDRPGYHYGWYVAFGYAVGPDGEDVHGAGAVRFDTKYEGGPAGEDAERVYNYVRLVRDVDGGGEVPPTAETPAAHTPTAEPPPETPTATQPAEVTPTAPPPADDHRVFAPMAMKQRD